MEEVEEGSSDNHSPRSTVVSPEANLSGQPWSDRDGPLRDTGAPSQATQGVYVVAPPIEEVRSAHADLKNILKPRQVTGKGYKDPEFDELFKSRLLSMKQFMWTYINPDSELKGRWTAASLATANNLEKGPAHARKLREWTQAFIDNREDLPVNPYGAWTKSVIDKYPEIAQELHAHL